MSIPLLAPSRREAFYQALLTHADGSVNAQWLAQIIASWQIGDGVLPDGLGLDDQSFAGLLTRHFPGYSLDTPSYSGIQADFSRMLEKQDLEQLLRRFARSNTEDSEWLITLIVTACLGSDHLWQDLGVFSRNDLSALLRHNFPALSALNHKDMKWKKFLYKLLCEEEGFYVCRAPSCEVCKDYALCFGPEDS